MVAVATVVVLVVVDVVAGGIHQTFEANYNLFFRKFLRGYFQGRVVCRKFPPSLGLVIKTIFGRGALGFCNIHP